MHRRLRLRNKKAFTIVELLISVSILAILSGVTINVINFGKKRANAQDAVRRSNIEKLAQSIESYCAAESGCPANADFTGSGSILRTFYIKAFPTDTTYTYRVSGTTNFIIYATKASDTNRCIKYRTTTGSIDECAIASCAGVYNANCP